MRYNAVVPWIIGLSAWGGVLLPGAAAAAEDVGERRLTFGAFGTLGAIYHEADGLEYRRATPQPDGAQSGELNLDIDSVFGVQLNAAWDQTLELVVQGTTSLTSHNDWQPQLSRAFVRYMPNANVSWRFGRLGWDIYPRADSRNIGYSHLAIRPQAETFGFIPTDSFDGGELSLTHPLGPGLVNFRAYGGVAFGDVVRADGSVNNIDHSKVWGAHVDWSQGGWIVRAGAGAFLLDQSPDIDPLVAGLRATGSPQAQALAEDFARKERHVLFFVLGAAYDEGPLQARLFVGRTQCDGIAAPNIDSGLLLGGYDLGSFTPYAGFSFVDSRDEIRGTGLPDTPQTAPLNAGAYQVQALTANNQHSALAGVRYDVLPTVAIKLQVDHVWFDDTTLVLDRRGGPPDDGEMTVLGLAVDFIF